MERLTGLCLAIFLALQAPAAFPHEGHPGEITWTFSKPGTFRYGCLEPGHWEAGMKGVIRVTASPP